MMDSLSARGRLVVASCYYLISRECDLGLSMSRRFKDHREAIAIAREEGSGKECEGNARNALVSFRRFVVIVRSSEAHFVGHGSYRRIHKQCHFKWSRGLRSTPPAPMMIAK